LEAATQLRLDPGQFVVLNPDVRHRHLELDGEKLLVELRPESVAEAAKQLGLRVPRFSSFRWAQPPLRELRRGVGNRAHPVVALDQKGPLRLAERDAGLVGSLPERLRVFRNEIDLGPAAAEGEAEQSEQFTPLSFSTDRIRWPTPGASGMVA
jgi:hypothetical protein